MESTSETLLDLPCSSRTETLRFILQQKNLKVIVKLAIYRTYETASLEVIFYLPTSRLPLPLATSLQVSYSPSLVLGPLSTSGITRTRKELHSSDIPLSLFSSHSSLRPFHDPPRPKILIFLYKFKRFRRFVNESTGSEVPSTKIFPLLHDDSVNTLEHPRKS